LAADLFTELCRQIENLFFCYLITREPTKTFERNFARWSKDLRAAHTAEELRAFVATNFHKDMASRSSAFDFAFGDLSESRIQKYRMRYILAKLTQHVDLAAWDNPAHATLRRYVDAAVHVEHILPRSPATGIKEEFDNPAQYSAYVEKLGNLTLLEKSINTSVSNGAYQAKIPGYKQSTFLLTKSTAEKPHVGVNTQVNRAAEDLISFDKWDSAAIEQRQDMLGRLARKVWMPGVTTPPNGA
jgi:hypothetical protein